MSSGARASIPNSAREAILSIREIAANHSDEEIYAMLKECNMDPNETANKLLLQDPFHEVKRKRDRRKENLSHKESAESRWKPGGQGRGSRGGRGNYAPRYMLNDANGGRSSASGKENEINQVTERGVGLLNLPDSQETKIKETNPTVSSVTVITNGPTGVATRSPVVVATNLSSRTVVNQFEGSSAVDNSMTRGPVQLSDPPNANDNPSTVFGTGHTHVQLPTSSSNSSTVGSRAPSPGGYFSASDPVLVPSQDSRLPSAVGAIKREVGSQRTPVEQTSSVSAEGKSASGSEMAASEVGSSSAHRKMPTKSIGAGPNQVSDSPQPAPSTRGSSVVRPSNNNSHPQQVIGSQKVGLSKEWKPKPTNPNSGQGSGVALPSEVPITEEANIQSSQVLSVLDSKEATSQLQRKLEGLHISNGKTVIIPNHLHVPEAERIGFCFGSFDASFSLNASCSNGPENDRNPGPLSETSDSAEEMAEQSSRNQNPLTITDEGDYPDHPQSPKHVPENLSYGEVCEGAVSSTAVPEYNESKQETTLPPGSHQIPMVHTSPSFSFGFMPTMVGGQLAQFESPDSQARDLPRLPSFVVPQAFDPVSYHAQFFRPGADGDGRISPFHPPGTAKYNGNAAILSPQTSQSVQEGGNSLMLSTAGPTLVTQAGGVMQNSIAVTQQPLPVFRQPTAMPIAHYPSNYLPYGPFFSPFYVPPPAIQFLSNGVFPHQPQTGSLYPTPPGASVKYSLPQYKAGGNPGNSAHAGVPSFGPYGSQVGYNHSSTSAAGNSNANEDVSTSQFKEGNVYITGQQSEGSGVWMTAPGRDVGGLPAGSFYNIPPQGQVTFAPSQVGHGSFPSVYHPAPAVSAPTVHPLLQQSQTMAPSVDIVGPTGTVCQQPQHAQINWPNNY
ncbi:hypothetical protein NMG60_11003312 [Bertholletia excelsa]